jgi:hypothetical protein
MLKEFSEIYLCTERTKMISVSPTVGHKVCTNITLCWHVETADFLTNSAGILRPTFLADDTDDSEHGVTERERSSCC